MIRREIDTDPGVLGTGKEDLRLTGVMGGTGSLDVVAAKTGIRGLESRSIVSIDGVLGTGGTKGINFGCNDLCGDFKGMDDPSERRPISCDGVCDLAIDKEEWIPLLVLLLLELLLEGVIDILVPRGKFSSLKRATVPEFQGGRAGLGDLATITLLKRLRLRGGSMEISLRNVVGDAEQVREGEAEYVDLESRTGVAVFSR